MPGEAQKIEKMVEVFAKRYIQCNQVRKKKGLSLTLHFRQNANAFPDFFFFLLLRAYFRRSE